MHNTFIIFLIFITIINTIICYKSYSIASFLKIIDHPNNKKKIHQEPTPLIGGIIFYINMIFYVLFDIITGSHPVTGSQLLFEIGFISTKQIIIIFIASTSIYLVSFYDDVYDIRPFRKIISFSIILYILIISNPNLPIKELQFYNLEKKIFFSEFSIYITLFCVLAFMNAANMFDGLNLQSAILYSSFLLIFFLKGINQNFLLIFLLSIIFFSYMNFRGKIFLGNNGSYFLSFLISIVIIMDHNRGKNYFVEEIFLYMLLPGIDMIRLTIVRYINNKSPFEGDNNHIHHILIKKFGYKKTIIIIFSIIFAPIMLFNLININPLILIILSLIIYSMILIFRSEKASIKKNYKNK